MTRAQDWNDSRWKIALDIIARLFFIAITLFLGIVTYFARDAIETIRDNEKRIARIEASQYTAKDAIEESRQVSEQITSLRKFIETQYPQSWLQKDVQELKAEVEALNLLVRDHIRDHRASEIQ